MNSQIIQIEIQVKVTQDKILSESNNKSTSKRTRIIFSHIPSYSVLLPESTYSKNPSS